MTQTSRPVALVTGARRGIGKAAAIALAEAGFDVACTARTLNRGEGIDDSDTGNGAPLPGSLEETTELIDAMGVRSMALFGDVLLPQTMVDAAMTVIDKWGRIDVLVNNAIYTGPGGMVRLVDLTPEQLELRLQGNVITQLILTQAVLPSMVAQGGGTIINVSSHVAVSDPFAPVGEGGWGFGYAATKAAFHKMAPMIMLELGDQGITAFNVDPGFVDTDKQLINKEKTGLAGHYVGAPPTVPGNVIAWLATDPEAKGLTGSYIRAQKLALERNLHPDWRV